MTSGIGDVVVSHIRTYVPILVGTVLTYVAVKLGVVVDETTSTAVVALVNAVTIAGYYALVRFVARWVPWVEILLGARKAPVYVEPLRRAA